MKKTIYIYIPIIIIIASIIMSLGYIVGYDEGKKIGYDTGYSAGYFDTKEIYEPEIENLSKQYEELALKNITSNPDYYYAEAYIISQDKGLDDMIVVAWCVNYSEAPLDAACKYDIYVGGEKGEKVKVGANDLFWGMKYQLKGYFKNYKLII